MCVGCMLRRWYLLIKLILGMRFSFFFSNEMIVSINVSLIHFLTFLKFNLSYFWTKSEFKGTCESTKVQTLLGFRGNRKETAQAQVNGLRKGHLELKIAFFNESTPLRRVYNKMTQLSLTYSLANIKILTNENFCFHC